MNVYMDIEAKIVKVGRLNVLLSNLKNCNMYSVAKTTDYFRLLNGSFVSLPFFRGD